MSRGSKFTTQHRIRRGGICRLVWLQRGQAYPVADLPIRNRINSSNQIRRSSWRVPWYRLPRLTRLFQYTNCQIGLANHIFPACAYNILLYHGNRSINTDYYTQNEPIIINIFHIFLKLCEENLSNKSVTLHRTSFIYGWNCLENIKIISIFLYENIIFSIHMYMSGLWLIFAYKSIKVKSHFKKINTLRDIPWFIVT